IFQRSLGPPLGQSVSSPVSGDLPLCVGPSQPGQSDAAAGRATATSVSADSSRFMAISFGCSCDRLLYSWRNPKQPGCFGASGLLEPPASDARGGGSGLRKGGRNPAAAEDAVAIV